MSKSPKLALARTRAAFAWALLGIVSPLLLGPSCGESALKRDCFARVWAPNDGQQRYLAGSFNGWVPEPLFVEHDPAWMLARLKLPAGDHGYMLVDGAGEALDPLNPMTTWRDRDQQEVSLLVVTDCTAPFVHVEAVTVGGNRVGARAQFLASEAGVPIEPTSVAVTTQTGAELPFVVDPETGVIEIAGELPDGKHTLTIRAGDQDGASAPPALLTAWPGRRMTSWEDGVLYQVMIDRFYGDGGAALAPPATPGSRAGGTLDGVRAALERGDLDALGVTALWLSPVYQNPDEPRQGLDGNSYEGYHGYWSTAASGVDARLGGDEALHQLVAAAHERGMAVILDVVPNHVYETHPRYLEHSGDDWFTPADCVCGTEDCPWGENLLRCWFTDYLPDVRLQSHEALADVRAETSRWIRAFDLDGARVDAVPMMPRGATRRMLHDLRHQVAPREATFLLGEVFTGPGIGALNELRFHIGEPGLDSVFDFPLMWSIRSAIAKGEGSFEDAEAILQREEEEFAGSGVLLSRILDNHDVPRFVSAATGEDGNHPWQDPPVQPSEDDPYDRLELAFALTFALPGLPTLFQGDEVGLAGANDPDNRRVMPAEASLLPRQVALREQVGRFAAVRSCSQALRRGDRRSLLATATQYAFERGDEAWVLLSTAPSASVIELEESDVGAPELVDVFSGERFSSEGGLFALPMAALGYRWLLAAGDPCLTSG